MKLALLREDRNIILAVRNELRQKVASGEEYKGNLDPQSKAVRMPKLIRLKNDEIKKFDANRVKQSFEMQVETDNYTQIVWAKTTEIGCGFTRYKNNQWNTNYLVCNYDPAGNIRNESTYEIAN
ncbi:PREDICTED: venom allergen 3-like [Atta colombica]|uniref:venom allergen 3-like n=1 Tax=Atta colombica TaxID=520822 RepID=UPI00084C15BE|nr:PREDICTED: venom allergen 3-like [Atta colombica]